MVEPRYIKHSYSVQLLHMLKPLITLILFL